MHILEIWKTTHIRESEVRALKMPVQGEIEKSP